MLEILTDLLAKEGLNTFLSNIIARGLIVVAIILISIITYFFVQKIILKKITKLIVQSATQWDDIILDNNVFNKIAYLAPAILLYMAIPIPLKNYNDLIIIVKGGIVIYIIIMSLLAINAFLNAFLVIYKKYEVSNRIPIKGFVQVFKIIIYFTGAIFIISILVNKTPIYLFSSLGALTAVLMFIFKDSILGFVAGIQLSANQMVANGDWIEMPKYGANGNIVEIALTTVKVQNWDKTITTVPTYALITESFKNWRGMSESDGRRIKRSITIDMNTIKFCTDEMLDRFSKIQYISDYIKETGLKLEESNRLEQVDDSSLVNGTRMTNIGTFRAYVKAYLFNHPMINKEMTFLIRQLPSTEHGLPIEIYVFCKDKDWTNYEGIQANIFDHILAVVPEFDLNVFQNPSGKDIKSIGS